MLGGKTLKQPAFSNVFFELNLLQIVPISKFCIKACDLRAKSTSYVTKIIGPVKLWDLFSKNTASALPVKK